MDIDVFVVLKYLSMILTGAMEVVVIIFCAISIRRLTVEYQRLKRIVKKWENR